MKKKTFNENTTGPTPFLQNCHRLYTTLCSIPVRDVVAMLFYFAQIRYLVQSEFGEWTQSQQCDGYYRRVTQPARSTCVLVIWYFRFDDTAFDGGISQDYIETVMLFIHIRCRNCHAELMSTRREDGHHRVSVRISNVCTHNTMTR